MSNLAHQIDPEEEEGFYSGVQRRRHLRVINGGDADDATAEVDNSLDEDGDSSDNVVSLADYRKKKEEKTEDSADELKEQEETTAEKSATKNDSEDSEDSDNSLNFTGGKKARTKFMVKAAEKRKQIATFLAVISAVTSIVSILVVQAPNLVMNQLKELLLSRVSQVQNMHSRKYRQSKLSKMRNLLTKDGRMGQKIIGEMEGAGYTFRFDTDGKTIIGISHPNGAGIIGDGVGDHIDAFMESRHPWRTSRWKTKRMNAFYEKFGVSRSSVIDKDKLKAGADGKAPDAEKIVNKEVAEDVLEGEDPKVQSVKSDNPDEKAKAEEDARLTAAEEQGSDIGDEFDKTKKDLIENGTNVEDLADGGLAKATSEAGENITADLGDVLAASAAKQGVGSKMFSTFKEYANPLDIADRVCTIRQRTEGAFAAARSAKAIKLIRYVWVFINAPDSMRQGKGSSKLASLLMRRIMTEDANGVPVAGSPAFGSLIRKNRTFSKSKNDDTRSAVAVDAKKTGLMGGISSKLDNVPGLGVGCPIAQNPVVQVGTGVVSIVAGLFSGGGSTALQQAFQQGFKVGVKEVVEKITEKIVVKEVIKEVVKGIAKELTFEAIMTLTEIYIQKSLKLPFTGQEKGGQLGGILAAGMGAGNKQRSLGAGFVPATKTQYAMAEQEYIAWKKDEMSKMSIKDRYLSMSNPDSVLFDATLSFQLNTGNSMRNMSDKTLAMASSVLSVGNLFKGMGNIISPHLHAEDGDEITYDTYKLRGGNNEGTELATDAAGNLQTIMRADIAAIDPESNRDLLIQTGDIDPTTLQPKSTAFIEHIDNCVSNPDQLSQLEGDDNYDCMALQEKTKEFKAHLAYLDLLDSMDGEFFPGEIDSATSTTPAIKDSQTPATVPATGGTGPIPMSETSIIPGTDKRIATTILPQFMQMVAAAQAGGVNLLPISSGWRDPQKQIELRKKNCPDWQNSPAGACSPPTAKPGTSNHEGGRAIDFGNMCYPNKTCAGNPRWDWLRANAAKYGFYPLASEAWHWSTTGR